MGGVPIDPETPPMQIFDDLAAEVRRGTTKDLSEIPGIGTRMEGKNPVRPGPFDIHHYVCFQRNVSYWRQHDQEGQAARAVGHHSGCGGVSTTRHEPDQG